MKKSSSAHPVRSNSAQKKKLFPRAPAGHHVGNVSISFEVLAHPNPSSHLKNCPLCLHPSCDSLWLGLLLPTERLQCQSYRYPAKKKYKLVGKYPIIHQLNFFELISHEQMIKNAWTWNLAPYSHVLARSYKVLPAQSPSTWLSSYIDSTWESLDATARPKKKHGVWLQNNVNSEL